MAKAGAILPLMPLFRKNIFMRREQYGKGN